MGAYVMSLGAGESCVLYTSFAAWYYNGQMRAYFNMVQRVARFLCKFSCWESRIFKWSSTS